MVWVIASGQFRIRNVDRKRVKTTVVFHAELRGYHGAPSDPEDGREFTTVAPIVGEIEQDAGDNTQCGDAECSTVGGPENWSGVDVDIVVRGNSHIGVWHCVHCVIGSMMNG